MTTTMIEETKKFTFVVTHVEAEGKLLKIWAQTDERLINTISTILRNLTSKIGPSNILLPHNITPDNYCCALGINNEFCRIKLYNIQREDLVLVKFIDYGIVTYLPIRNIYSLNNFPEAVSLFSLPKAASAFILANVLPIADSWLEIVVNQIRTILVNNKFDGIYQTVNNYRMLKFNFMNNNFSQMLISRNMAVYSPYDEQIVLPLNPVRMPHQTLNMPQENWRIPVLQNPVPPQKVVKSNSFKAIQLEIGSVHDVQVSYVDEGPCKFSVQLIESVPYLNSMMEKINSRSHLPLQEPPIAGQVCLGKQTHLNRLCRIVLNSPGDTSCKVYYADYGHHEVLPFSDIYQIPDEFVVPNIFSIRFTLSGIINWVVSDEMKDYFGGLVYNKPLKLRVCQGPMSPLIQYCDLFVHGKNVKDTLSEAYPDSCRIMYSEPNPLLRCMKLTVFVSYVESTTKFYVQREKEGNLLEEVMNLIEQASKTAAKLSSAQIYSNMPCIALYEVDKNWYRASIMGKVDNDKIKVFYVDYGNQEVVSINNIRAIPSELITLLPKQAIKCSLNGFQSGVVDKELVKNFESLVLDEKFNLVVLEDRDKIVVDLFVKEPNSSGKNITTMLKSLENSKDQKTVTSSKFTEKNQESSYQTTNQKCDVKTQLPLAQKQKTKNKNSKSRDNWIGNWEKEGGQGQYFKTNNNFEPYENSKPKFRKDNENERYDNNRYKRVSSVDHTNETQNNRYDKEGGGKGESRYPNNRFGRNNSNGSPASKEYSNSRTSPRNNSFDSGAEGGGHAFRVSGAVSAKETRSNVSCRLDRHYGSDKSSDKESDISTRSNERRSNRIGGGKRIAEDHRKYDGSTNNRNNRPGRWENKEQRESGGDLYRKNNDNSNVNTKSRSPKDNCTSGFDKQRNVEQETVQKLSSPPPNNKDSSKYSTPTSVFKIPPPNITVGAIKNCEMVYYTDPSNFYVQLCPDNDELHVIMNKIAETVQSGGKALHEPEVKTGQYCIAQYSEDHQWYRAVVNNVKGQQATVHFVDYGNVERVSFDKIKEIEAEFLKLPTQAVHCKLFCPLKASWTKEESNLLSSKLEEKLFEAEFVTEENGIYNILVKEAASNASDSPKYINDLFANGMNLVKEKEAVRNKAREMTQGEKFVPSDYASLDDKWLDNKLDPGSQCDVTLTWFINPENFYCQLVNQQQVFREMMIEIQSTYVKRQPVSEKLKIGSSVIAVLPDDGILYRAEIVELFKPRGHVVQYIDYGDRAMVDPRNIYPVEKKYFTLPRQAIFCSLKNIVPISGSNWPNSTEMSQFFNVEKFDCTFHESKNCKYLISLRNKGVDVSSALVDKNMAVFSSIATDELPKDECLEEDSVEVPKMDINLLERQTLDVRVSHVENVGKFYVQFYTVEACQAKVDNFMANKDTQVISRLSCNEVCLGAGCLVNLNGKWRRSVVINFTETICEVRLIDTGEHERVSFNSMLRLPVQLSAMQNQAIECALVGVSNSPEANEMLKKTVTGKDAKIFVERVECNRLLVEVFDLNGNKIIVSETQTTGTISPVCNMQILSSTHDVTVTWINNSNSIWLQRESENSILSELFENLDNHYSKLQERVIPNENQVYAVLSNHGVWYRAKVIKVQDENSTIMLIDFGNILDVSIENLRTLDPRFYSPHQLAIEVSLTVTLGSNENDEKNVLEPILMNKVFSATLYNVNRKWVAELVENGEKISEKLASLDVIKESPKKQFEYMKLAEMSVGEKYEVVVSHVDSPNQLWVQRVEQVSNISELQSQLQQASSPLLDSEVVPPVKSLCLALYSLDNQWYRAEVLDADIEITTVRFIDYGSTDVIENGSSCLKQLPDKWKTIDGYAIPCKLDVLPATADDWPKEACTRFSELVLTQKSLQALIIADKAPMRIDLFLDDRSICKMLVEEKLAAFLNCPEELVEEIVEEVELDPRSAFVSSIISVDTFWMQEDKHVNELEMMQDRLVMAPMLQPVTDVKEGLICIAHFPEDNYYYRAVVLSHSEDGTRVRYIDYGNSAITKDLKTIPEDLVEIRPLSRKCCLAKPDGVEHWPQGINNEFTKLADEGSTIFLLDVIEEGETCLVKLIHDGKDVAMELLELCAKANKVSSKQEDIIPKETENVVRNEKEEKRIFPADDEEQSNEESNVSSPDTCTVCYVNSPSEFWIHKKNHYSDLDAVMNELLMAERLDLMTDIKEGQILAAKFDEDGQWYRSKVLSHGESGTEVFYIDYGNEAITESHSTLRKLPDNISRIPPLATCCSLKMPEHLESWSKAMCEKFMDLTEDLAIEFQFKVLETNVHSESEHLVQISLSYDGQDVVDIMLNHDKAMNTQAVDEEQTEETSKDKIMEEILSQESKSIMSLCESEHPQTQQSLDEISSSNHLVNINIETKQSEESKSAIVSLENKMEIEVEQNSTSATSKTDCNIETRLENLEIKDTVSSSIDNNIEIKLEGQELQASVISSSEVVQIETTKQQLQEATNTVSVSDSNTEIKTEKSELEKETNNRDSSDITDPTKLDQPFEESKGTISLSKNNDEVKVDQQVKQESLNNISSSEISDPIKVEQHLEESKDTISLSENNNEVKEESQKSLNNISCSDKVEQRLDESEGIILSSENNNEVMVKQESLNNISSSDKVDQIQEEKNLEESKDKVLLSENNNEIKIEQESQKSLNNISCSDKVEQHLDESKGIILLSENNNEVKSEQEELQKSLSNISLCDKIDQIKVEQHLDESKPPIFSPEINIKVEIEQKELQKSLNNSISSSDKVEIEMK